MPRADSAPATQNGCGTFLRVSKFPYENAIQDMTHHLEVREREFAVLDVPAEPASLLAQMPLRCWQPGAQVEKLEDGFLFHLRRGGRCAGQALLRRPPSAAHLWLVASEGLTIERDNPLDPVNLAFDKSGDLLVLSSPGRREQSTPSGPAQPKIRSRYLRRKNAAAAGCAGAHACELLE